MQCLTRLPVRKPCPASAAALWVPDKSRQGVLVLLVGGCNGNISASSAASADQHCLPAAISPRAPHDGARSPLLPWLQLSCCLAIKRKIGGAWTSVPVLKQVKLF